MDERLIKPLLLVIDMQNVYSQEQIWECENFSNVCKNIQKLINNLTNEQTILTRYIASENPIGIWKDYNRENINVNNNAWLNEIVDELKDSVEKHDCYDKSVYSSLSIKEIKEATQEKTCVVVTGVVAECCVLSTVMDLIDAGVYVIYLKDAVAGISKETEAATLKVLEGLSPLHLRFMDTEEYISNKRKIKKYK